MNKQIIKTRNNWIYISDIRVQKKDLLLPDTILLGHAQATGILHSILDSFRTDGIDINVKSR